MESGTGRGPALGWIGTGKMGRPMALRLLAQGHPLALFEPSGENRRPLEERGASAASGLPDLAARADLVFCTIPDDAALRAVVLGPQGLAAAARPGTVLVEMSTVSPAASAEVAEALRAAGVHYLRAPVSGSTALAAAGGLTVLASGDPEAWAAAEPLLAVLSARRFHLGAGEEARYMKLALNALVGGTAALLAEALALGEAGGLSRAAMAEVIEASAVASPLIRYKRAAIVEGDLSPAFELRQMVKDMGLIAEAGRQSGVPLALAGLVLRHYLAAEAAGHGGEDFFALLDWQRDLSASP